MKIYKRRAVLAYLTIEIGHLIKVCRDRLVDVPVEREMSARKYRMTTVTEMHLKAIKILLPYLQPGNHQVSISLQ